MKIIITELILKAKLLAFYSSAQVLKIKTLTKNLESYSKKHLSWRSYLTC